MWHTFCNSFGNKNVLNKKILLLLHHENLTLEQMKRLFTLLLLAGMLSISTFAAKSDYKLNSMKVNQMFENSMEVNFENIIGNSLNEMAMHKSAFIGDDVQTAVIIALLIYFTQLEFIGFHRYILGTKPTMFAYYLFTCGGVCGVVPLIDFFVLLIDGALNDNGEKYIDNEQFLMWN